KLASQEFDYGVDLTGTIGTDCFPTRSWNRGYVYFDFVYRRSTDQCRHGAVCDLQIDHRSVAYIGAATRKTVRVVAVALEIVAPGFAPECLRYLKTIDGDRL